MDERLEMGPNGAQWVKLAMLRSVTEYFVRPSTR